MSEKVPDEFYKIIKDLVNDLTNTFPEYKPFIQKWWKDDSYYNFIEEEDERNAQIKKAQDKSTKFIYNFCMKKFPPRFFDILYQNDTIFKEESTEDTEFLPQIHFKNLWQCDISEKTRETIWKYLQLILFTIIGNVENREAFGDTSKLFEFIDESEFKTKLESTLSEMQGLFNQEESEKNGQEERQGEGEQKNNIPNADEIHSHISGMLNGKLGELAKEIAEETANELNLDMENVTDAKDVFQKLLKNPGKMMNLVKNIGGKLDTKIKSGEIKESELISEASDIINKMKTMPGMQNVQQMLSQMGLGGIAGKGKMNLSAMESQLKRTMKEAQMKERMREKANKKNGNSNSNDGLNSSSSCFSGFGGTNNEEKREISEEELFAFFSKQEKPEKTPRVPKSHSDNEIKNVGSGKKKKSNK